MAGEETPQRFKEQKKTKRGNESFRQHITTNFLYCFLTRESTSELKNIIKENKKIGPSVARDERSQLDSFRFENTLNIWKKKKKKQELNFL